MGAVFAILDPQGSFDNHLIGALGRMLSNWPIDDISAMTPKDLTLLIDGQRQQFDIGSIVNIGQVAKELLDFMFAMGFVSRRTETPRA